MIHSLIADKIDTNKDNKISKDELKAWITHSAKRLARLFSSTFDGNFNFAFLANFLKLPD